MSMHILLSQYGFVRSDDFKLYLLSDVLRTHYFNHGLQKSEVSKPNENRLQTQYMATCIYISCLLPSWIFKKC